MKKLNMLFVLISFGIAANISAQQFDYSPGFDAGKPVDMNKLSFLEGKWEITLYYTLDKTSPSPKWQFWAQSASTFSQSFNGSFITEESKGFPIAPAHEGFDNWEYFAVYSYDRFNKQYRITYYDNILGLADIYEGHYDDNKLEVSNINTATYNNHGENMGAQKTSVIIRDLKEDEFTLIWRVVDEKDIPDDPDDTIPWKWSVKMVYKKLSGSE